MDSDKPDRPDKKVQLKLKLVKDFAFLLDHKPIPFNNYCTKYILDEGEGDGPIGQQSDNFDIFYSYKKYDYEGRLLVTISIAKANRYEKNESDLQKCILSMKLKERVWLNVSNSKVNEDDLKITEQKQKCQIDSQEQIQDFDQIDQKPHISSQNQPIIEQDTLNSSQNELGRQKTENDVKIKEKLQKEESQRPEYIQKRQQSGCHYQITLERIQYKNSDDFDRKRKVFTQKKEESKKLFSQRKYQEAAKVYNFLDSITSNLPRYKKNPVTGEMTDEPFYTSQQKFELQEMNINSRINFLKCIFKMIEFKIFLTDDMETMAKKNVTILLNMRPNDSVVKFLQSKWLLKERLLDSALQAAKRSYALQKTTATLQLINLINQERANKGKIKVKVQQ